MSMRTPSVSTPLSGSHTTPQDSVPVGSGRPAHTTPTGSVVVNLNSHPTILNVVQPRVGGVLDLGDGKGEAFTGGSNLIGVQMIPMHIRQRRCTKMSAQTEFLDVLQKGTEFKLGSKRESSAKGSCSLVRWFQGVADTMEHLGLDTIFCIPNATWTGETNILKNWGKVTPTLVNDWLQELKTGVVDNATQKKVFSALMILRIFILVGCLFWLLVPLTIGCFSWTTWVVNPMDFS